MRMCQKKTQNAIGLLDCSQAPAPLIFLETWDRLSPVAANQKSEIRNQKFCFAFTLIEMLIVVAIIAILISMVIGLGARFDNQGKERLTRETIGIIGNALEQFRDFGYEYKNDYAGLIFPLDFNDFRVQTISEYPNTLAAALDLPVAAIGFVGLDSAGLEVGNLADSPQSIHYSGCEAMYFFLSQVPDCRATLDKIDKSLVTASGFIGVTPVTRAVRLTVNGVSTYSLLYRITDPWRTDPCDTTLRYDYYDESWPNHAGTWAQRLQYRDNTKNTFPVITSAGADRSFDTADDISNRQKQ